jgi:PAS domain S-box-containing protein
MRGPFGSLWFRATLALFAVACALVPVGVALVALEHRAAAADEEALRGERVESDVQGLETGVLAECAGLRAYLLTGDATLLREYDVGHAEAALARAALVRDAPGTDVEGGVPPLMAADDAWQAWASRRRAEAVLAPGRSASLGDGEPVLERLQTAAARLEAQASSQAARDRAEAAAIGGRARLLGMIAPIAGPACLLLLGSGLLWLALRPVRSLARAANRLAGGLDPEIGFTDRRDEAGDVARALASWRRAAASQRLIWQHSPLAMMVYGADFGLRQVNPAELALFLVDPARFKDREYMATIVTRVGHPDDARATTRMYGRLLSGRSETEHLEKRYVRSDGSQFWGHAIVTVIRNADGTPDHYLAMIEDITERRERVERAGRVQRDLLPDSPPELDGYELAGLCRPSHDIGGDFFDWYSHGPGALTLTLGDVTGKDMSAALLMAMVRIALRTTAGQPTVGEAVRSAAAATGRELARAGAFMTLFHGRLDAGTGVVTYVDAGHGLLAVVGADGVRRPAATESLPLGVMDEDGYAESSVALAPGDALLVLTDGVLAAHPELDAGLAALGPLLAGAASAQEMVDRLARGSAAATDDVTVVVLRRQPAAV